MFRVVQVYDEQYIEAKPFDRWFPPEQKGVDAGWEESDHRNCRASKQLLRVGKKGMYFLETMRCVR